MLFKTDWAQLPLALIFFTCALTGYSVPVYAQNDCKGAIFQKGVASIYGYGWDKNKTANSEHFQPDAMTAAHPSLPFGTMVQITDIKSGATTMVRINDRGPFVKGRIIDVTPAVRRELGWEKTGLHKVSLRICPL